MTYCIVMRSNSVNFLTLYSIIFFNVFFSKALFWRRCGALHPQRNTMITSVIDSGLFFACQGHAFLVTSYKRNEVERNMGWAIAQVTSVWETRYFLEPTIASLPFALYIIFFNKGQELIIRCISSF